MKSHVCRQIIRTLLLSCFALGLTSIPMVGQNQGGSNSTNAYYRQAYDSGFRAGQSDSNAHRSYSYNAALVTSAGVSAISSDYRNAFKLGYQDGYYGYGRDRGSDWSYKQHHHDSDCAVDNSRGEHDWSCREHHDNGKHKGWYKKHHQHSDDQGENEDNDKKKH